MDFDRTYADYLGDKDIKAIAKLEKKIGKRLLAYYTPPATHQISVLQKSFFRTLPVL